MTTRMRFLTVIVLLCLQLGEISAHPPNTDGHEAQQTESAGLHGTDPTGDDDRELKNNEDGYDFFSIDQLFMNNPQYAKLLNDLQAHSFGSNWRRKRDATEEDESIESPVEDPVENPVEEPVENPEEILAESPVEASEETSVTASIAEITEVTKEMKDSKETNEISEVEGRTTPLRTTSAASTTASGTFGFSGSTEASRIRTEEPTTSSAPIRSSTPRRLLHKGGNKNKNKQGGGNKQGSHSQNNQNKQQDQSTSSVTALNVNKFTVTNTPSLTSPVSSSSNSAASTHTAAAVNSSSSAAAVAAVVNATSAGGNTKDKVGLAPTKYHYYPHNQHIYFLPECAIQQVCNAVYVRLNYTQPLCACPPRYRDPCSASLNEDDNHTIKLVGNAQRKAVTLAKTCENTNELRECRAPKDWSILALQNSRTGKSHYLVICKCPSNFRLEGPLAHDQPTYAGLPGINVYGMLCVPPESYAPKPVKSPSSSSIYNKWKVRPSVSSYRDTEYRSFQNSTMATADVE